MTVACCTTASRCVVQLFMQCSGALVVPICHTHLQLSARIGPRRGTEVGGAQIGHGIRCEVGHVTSQDFRAGLTHMNAHQGREGAAALTRRTLHCTLA